MKVAIIGDVHLTLRKHKEFEEKRFKLLIDELIAAKPQIIIFAGDLLDVARPSIEELGLFYSALAKLEGNGIKVRIIDGNHEALTESTSLYDYIMPDDKRYVKDGYIYHIRNVAQPNLGIRLSGWTSVKTAKHEDGHVLITHLRANHGLLKEEYDIKHLSETYGTVFMGDLHFRYSPYDNVHYTSSPYSTKFTDKSLSDYGYIMLETQDYSWEYINLNLPCKVKAKCICADVPELIKHNKKHLLKLEVSGTLEELESLPIEDNVIYQKVVQESLVIAQVQTPNTDVLDKLSTYVTDSDFVEKYPNSEQKVQDKIKELKG